MTTGTLTRSWNDLPVAPARHVEFRVVAEEAGLRVWCRARLFSTVLPPGPPGPTPKLWEHEVVELFVGGAEGYTEVELSPFGNHLVLRLGGYRERLEEGLALEYAAVIRSDAAGRVWEGEARVPWALLPTGPLRMNVCAVQPGPIYLQWSPANGAQPDFHDAACWREVEWSRS